MKKLIALTVAALTLLLSGCGSSSGSIFSNYRETEHLQLVQAFGADTSEDGESVTISVSCTKPAQNSSGGIISHSGESIVRAMDSLQNYSADQQLYYSHAEYVLMGEEYAKGRAKNLFDFIARDTQLRLGIYLFVVKGSSAQELITGPGEESYELGRTLSSVRRDTEDEGTSHVFTARETLRSLSQSGAALICALRPVSTEDVVFLLDPGITAVAEGYGVLKDGVLAGYIGPEVSQAVNLIMGKIGTAGVSIPDGRGGRLNLEYEGGSTKISPKWAADGSLESIEVKAKLEANLAEPDSDIQNVTDSELLKSLEEALGKDMKGKMEEVLAFSRELDADFLGIGSYLRQSDAEKTAQLGEDWLKNAKFSVKCEAKISYTRELGDQMGSEGGGQ